MVRATFDALKNSTTLRSGSKRGKSVEDIFTA
jgi:ribosomal protein S5